MTKIQCLELFHSKALHLLFQFVTFFTFFTVNSLETSDHQLSNIRDYSKISIISPELILVHKALLMGLFSGELIFEGWGGGGGGLVIRRIFAFQNGLGLTIKTA